MGGAPERKVLVRQLLGASRIPISPNSPCKQVAPEASGTSQDGGAAYCLYPAFREQLPGRNQLHHARADVDRPADNFRGRPEYRRVMYF